MFDEELKKPLTRQEEKELDEKFRKDLKDEETRLREERKLESFLKSLPNQKPTEFDDEKIRLVWFRRYKEKIGQFSSETIVNFFLETGQVLGPLPRSRILNLSPTEAEHLRKVNFRTYENLLRKGLKVGE